MHFPSCLHPRADYGTRYGQDTVNLTHVSTLPILVPFFSPVSPAAAHPRIPSPSPSPLLSAVFKSPQYVALSNDQRTLYVGQLADNRVRSINLATGFVSTFASVPGGTGDGTGQNADLSYPQAMAMDQAGNMFVAERSAGRVRKLTILPPVLNVGYTCPFSPAYAPTAVPTPVTATVPSPEPTASPTTAFPTPLPTSFQHPPSNGTCYSSFMTGYVTAFVGTVTGTGSPSNRLALGPAGTAVYTGPWPGTAAGLAAPAALVLSPDQRTLYVASSTYHYIRMVDVPSQNVTHLAGSMGGGAGHVDAIGTASLFYSPTGIALSSDGSKLYVAGALFYISVFLRDRCSSSVLS